MEREVEQSISPSAAPSQSTTQLPNTSSGAGLLLNSIYKQESNNSFPSQQDLLDEKKLEVAVALSMLVGIFQVGSDNQAAAFLSFCIVIFLDFHSAKQGLPLVDFWSRGLD